MKYNLDKALELVKALSFPRRTGSPGEVQAQDYIIQRFKAIGMEPRDEEFSFTPVLGFMTKGFLLMVLLPLTALHFLFPFYPLLGIVLSLVILILVFCFLWGRPAVALIGWALFREIPFLQKLHSKNIIATWPTPIHGSGEPQLPFPGGKGVSQYAPTLADIYILAHYDSKSQTIPLGVRIPLVAAVLLSTSFSAGYHLLIPWAGLPVQGMADRVSFMVALTGGLMLLWTKTRNLSPGAIDNASGVAVMLHVAETIRKDVQRFNGLKFHFVATGAEEEGLVGAFWLCKSVGAYCNMPLQISEGDPIGRPYAFFINLDGVGTKGRIYCTSKVGLHRASQGQKGFVSLIREVAERKGLKVYTPPLMIGAMADHFPFVAAGFNAVTFSAVSRRSLWVHTSWDTPEMVETEGIERMGRLILGIISCLSNKK